MNDFSTPNSARSVMEAAARDKHSPEKIQARTLSKIEKNTKSLSELERIADAAQRQARIAENEAASAKKDARFSKVVSIISLIIGLGSLGVAVATLVFS